VRQGKFRKVQSVSAGCSEHQLPWQVKEVSVPAPVVQKVSLCQGADNSTRSSLAGISSPLVYALADVQSSALRLQEPIISCSLVNFI